MPPIRNVYWIPGDGIAREVIQADICRYLGNDALVRPDVFEGREGYRIQAYRNLTSEMIADLKADSRRWQEENATDKRSNYRASSMREVPVAARKPAVGPMDYPEPSSQSYRQSYGPGAAQAPTGMAYSGSIPASTSGYDQAAYTYGQPSGYGVPSGDPYTPPPSGYVYGTDYGSQGQPRTAPYPYGQSPTGPTERASSVEKIDTSRFYPPGPQTQVAGRGSQYPSQPYSR
ncbi:hypothetical protein L228DRAFT_268370 [Xylona heveae TC161]|uniref:Transcription factor RfeG n=1 Tax=Xylona heveae (strain CBS 132557 / TC161) TaxID=1328760 RepID=A0A165H5C8_XYLHT|nr:hypothetical protein L228DRAFT_268370 [Xylona heveae TC161]KZF23006.1 hypothetical protein L228DRAFT_268370 [Xylona heveae TC161]